MVSTLGPSHACLDNGPSGEAYVTEALAGIGCDNLVRESAK
jgi:hypothetical protein